jgi:hypothetical protein
MFKNKFFNKKMSYGQKSTYDKLKARTTPVAEKVIEEKTNNENKKNKKPKDMMTTEEKVKLANEILQGQDTQKDVKRIKVKDGLIERESSIGKSIITEDNKELLLG